MHNRLPNSFQNPREHVHVLLLPFHRTQYPRSRLEKPPTHGRRQPLAQNRWSDASDNGWHLKYLTSTGSTKWARGSAFALGSSFFRRFCRGERFQYGVAQTRFGWGHGESLKAQSHRPYVRLSPRVPARGAATLEPATVSPRSAATWSPEDDRSKPARPYLRTADHFCTVRGRRYVPGASRSAHPQQRGDMISTDRAGVSRASCERHSAPQVAPNFSRCSSFSSSESRWGEWTPLRT